MSVKRVGVPFRRLNESIASRDRPGRPRFALLPRSMEEFRAARSASGRLRILVSRVGVPFRRLNESIASRDRPDRVRA